jgi:hypothetical protein
MGCVLPQQRPSPLPYCRGVFSDAASYGSPGEPQQKGTRKKGGNKNIFCRVQVERKAIEALLEQIRAERCGEPVDRQLLQHLLRMLTALGVSHCG